MTTTPIDRLRSQHRMCDGRIRQAAERADALAEALAEALEQLVNNGPLCHPEDKERCHCCEGSEKYGHAGDCDWMLGQDALRAYKEANNE